MKSSPEQRALFPGSSEMAELCRSYPWDDSPLGPPASWPSALRAAVRTMLESPFAMCLICGPELVLVYNDAYRDILGTKHPEALGGRAPDTWSEIWGDAGGLVEKVRAGGPVTYAENAHFRVAVTAGAPRDGYFTFSLSPVRDDEGVVVAVLNIAMETTARVLAERESQYAQESAKQAGREMPVRMHNQTGADTMCLDFVYQPLTDAYGDRIGVVGFGSNVTDAVNSRKEVERLLQESERARVAAEESEARYRFLAGAIPVHVWTATPDGMLDFASERTRQYLGLREEEIMGSGWLSALHPDDVARGTERWMHSIGSGDPYEVEFRIWSAVQSTYRWHLVRASAQRDESGTIIRWFGTNTDIEEWKSAQLDLQRLTREAQEANRSKSDFLAAMSHELRTPLNAIGGYAQLIELGVRGPVTDEQLTDLRRIQRSKAHLDGLVSSVLDFAKVGAGHIELRTVQIDVETMMSSVLEMVSPQLTDKGLILVPTGVSPRLAAVGDVDKTRQILLNLLANALKFTPAGGSIQLDVESSAGEIRFRVSDTGIGIAPEQLDRIFEPFVQASSALHVAGIGVGLGLAISRQLARAMGGDVSAASSLGAGSTFTLTLPASA